MGKKKNLSKESNSVQAETLSASKIRDLKENINGKETNKCSKTTNGISEHETESHSVTSCYVNGVDSDVNGQQTSHNKNQSKSSQEIEGEKPLANGLADDDSRTFDSSETDPTNSSQIQNSFSSPRDIDKEDDVVNVAEPTSLEDEVSYIVYESELQMPDIMRLIQKDLSEPYSIYTYRYFIHNWPHLCFMVFLTFVDLIGSRSNGSLVRSEGLN